MLNLSKQPERILIYRIASLGDTIAGLPAIRAVREAFPLAHTAILTSAPDSTKVVTLERIIEHEDLADEVIRYPLATRDIKELTALRSAILNGRFDLLVYLTGARGLFNSVRDYCFFKSCGVRRITGIPWRKRDLICQEIAGTGRYEAEWKRIFRRLEPLGLGSPDSPPRCRLNLREEEIAKADELLEDSGISQPFLAASLGTKVPAKDWGLDNWRGTLEKVTSEFPNLGLVLIGSGDEHSRSEKARAVWRGDCVNLCGKASPRISAAIMSRASLFVGHDSGPMHLAAAVGTSCVAIFALRNPPHQWFPMGEGHTIFYPSLPFDKARTNDFAYQRRAIESISQEEVSREITQRLAALVAKEEMSELP